MGEVEDVTNTAVLVIAGLAWGSALATTGLGLDPDPGGPCRPSCGLDAEARTLLEKGPPERPCRPACGLPGGFSGAGANGP